MAQVSECVKVKEEGEGEGEGEGEERGVSMLTFEHLICGKRVHELRALLVIHSSKFIVSLDAVVYVHS